MTDEARSVSLWNATAVSLPFPALLEDATADVCVIGAGIAGLSVAYELALRGHAIVLIDSAGIGAGMTARTTAHLSSAFDDRYHEVERLHGSEAARQVAASHTAALYRAAKIAKDEAIDCDLE